MINRNPPGAKLATRIAFLVSGFGVACWAPLVPLAKARLRIDDGTLGLLLLCLGLGSVGAMQLVGPLVSRVGAKPVIVATGIGLALCLPLLAIAPTAPLLAGALILFGACLGSIDVAMNVHAVGVERCEARPLMSGFHGLFSIGGFAGSSLVTLGLSAALGPLFGVVVASAMMLGAMAIAAPRLIATPRSEDTPLLVVPRGVVALLAILAGITFLTEGAILDWGALLLTSRGLVGPEQAGIGYSVFAIAMTIGRLTGDAVVARLGDRHTMLWGGVLAIVGYAVLLLAPIITVALLGLLLIGLGASNTVPVLFRRAGAQGAMPAGLAVASVTTIGYAGVLAGPAAIGFVAQHTGLPTAFWVLAALLCLVPLAASAATREQAA